MALKINLKDGESVFFGRSKVTAVRDGGYTILVVEGADLPVMKESEMVSLEDADTPEKRIYFHLQQHYLSGGDEHLKIADTIAEVLSVEAYAVYEDALAAIRGRRAFAGLKAIRQFVGL